MFECLCVKIMRKIYVARPTSRQISISSKKPSVITYFAWLTMCEPSYYYCFKRIPTHILYMRLMRHSRNEAYTLLIIAISYNQRIRSHRRRHSNTLTDPRSSLVSALLFTIKRYYFHTHIHKYTLYGYTHTYVR